MNKYINGLIILISLLNDFKKKNIDNHDNNEDNDENDNFIKKYTKKIINKIKSISRATSCSRNICNQDEEIKNNDKDYMNIYKDNNINTEMDSKKFNNTQDYLDNINNIYEE